MATFDLPPLELRLEVSSLMLDMVSESERATDALQRVEPSPGSVGDSRLVDRTSLNSGYADIFASLVAVQQSSWALARLLRDRHKLVGPPILGLARSCVEAASRAWYLLDEAEPLQLRRLQLQHAELKHLDPQIVLQAKGDLSVTVEDRRAQLVAELADLGTKPGSVGFSGLARRFLHEWFREGHEDQVAPVVVQLYSRLSGASHGETLMLNSLAVGVDPLGQHPQPISLSAMWCSFVLRCVVSSCTLTTGKVVRHFDAPKVADRWSQASARLEQRARAAMDGLDVIVRRPANGAP